MLAAFVLAVIKTSDIFVSVALVVMFEYVGCIN